MENQVRVQTHKYELGFLIALMVVFALFFLFYFYVLPLMVTVFAKQPEPVQIYLQQ